MRHVAVLALCSHGAIARRNVDARALAKVWVPPAPATCRRHKDHRMISGLVDDSFFSVSGSFGCNNICKTVHAGGTQRLHVASQAFLFDHCIGGGFEMCHSGWLASTSTMRARIHHHGHLVDEGTAVHKGHLPSETIDDSHGLGLHLGLQCPKAALEDRNPKRLEPEFSQLAPCDFKQRLRLHACSHLKERKKTLPGTVYGPHRSCAEIPICTCLG